MKEFHLYKTIIKLRLKNFEVLSVMIIFPIILTTIFMQVFSNLEKQPEIEGRIAIYSTDEQIGGYYIQALNVLEEQNESVDFEVTQTADRQGAEIVIDIQAKIIIIDSHKLDKTTIDVLVPLTKSFVNQLEIDYTGKVPYRLIRSEMDIVPMWMTIGIAMIIFTSLLGGQYGITQVVDLRKPVGTRILHLGISKKRIYVIYGLASITLLFIQLVLVCVAYQFIFGIEILRRMDLLVVILILMSALSVAIGTVIGIWIKDEGMASGILSAFVTVTLMLSGGMMPNVDMPIAKFNPLKYVIDALVQIVQEGKVDGFIGICMGMLGITLIIITIGMIKIRKGEV